MFELDMIKGLDLCFICNWDESWPNWGL